MKISSSINKQQGTRPSAPASLVLALLLVSLRARATTPPPDPLDVDAVVVTGTRSDRRHAASVVATEVVSRRDVEASGARTLAELLEERPGIELERTYSGSAVRLQGLDPEYVLILVDGEPVIGRSGGNLALERIATADIERVEIVRGPTSALYGSDALGGVINVITRKATEPFEGDARAGFGQYGRYEVGASTRLARPDWDTALSLSWSRGDTIDLDEDDVATDVSGYDLVTGNARFGVRLTPRARLRLDSSYSLRDLDAVDDSETGAVFDRRIRTQNVGLVLGSDVGFGETPDGDALVSLAIDGSYGLYVEDFLSDQRRSAALDTDERTQQHLARLSVRADTRLAASHQLVTGGEVFFERLDSPRLTGETDRYRGALYAQHEWAILRRAETSQLALVTGLRVDMDREFGVAPSPKLALRWDPHERVTLRAGVGLGFRAPSFSEQFLRFENPGVGYVVTGNPDLTPEHSVGVNVSVEARPWRWLDLELNAFWNGLDDLIEVDTGATAEAGFTTYSYRNVASAWTAGLDSTVGFRLAAGLRLGLGYSFLQSWDDHEERPLARRAEHRGTASLRWSSPSRGVLVSVRAAVTGPSPVYEDTDGDGEDDTRHTDAFATVDARVALDVVQGHLSLYVLGENLLGAGDPVDAPITPLTLSAGLTGQF